MGRILVNNNSVDAINAALLQLSRQGQDLQSISDELSNALGVTASGLQTSISETGSSLTTELQTSLNTTAQAQIDSINKTINQGIADIQSAINKGISDLNSTYQILSNNLITLEDSLEAQLRAVVQ